MTWVFGLIALLLLAYPVEAGQPDSAYALQKSQSVLGNRLPDLQFADTSGNPVKLAGFAGRPVVISLVYTGCTDACPAMIDNLYPAVKLANSTLGEEKFSVITVGFDVRHDTPARMRSFARQHGADLPGWWFLSADADTVERLSSAVGFEIVPSAGGFDHMAQITIADAEGRIYTQIYGGAFSPQAVVDPLLELVLGRQRPLGSIAGLVDRVKLFCTVYNPNTGRYYFNYSLFIGIAIGLACLLSVALWLVREFRRGPVSQGRG